MRVPQASALVWRAVWLGLAVAALVGLVAALGAAPANVGSLVPLWIASAGGVAALSGVWIALARGERRESAHAHDARAFVRSAAMVLAVAAAVRVAVIVVHAPSLSDDIYRYVFDGCNTTHGVNPYVVRPDERAHASAGDERWPGEARVAQLVNNPELTTVYLPASQWVFALGALLTPPGTDDPLVMTRVFRGLFVALELAAIAVVLITLRRLGRSPWWAVLYAWHPLAVTEIAGSGHQEAFGLLLLAVAVSLYSHTRSSAPAVCSTSAIALASLVKPVALPAAALLLRGRPLRTWLASLAAAGAVAAAVALPFFVGGGGEALRNLVATTERFALKWAHFGSVYEPLLALIERLAPMWANDAQEQLSRAICAGLLAGVLVVLLIRRGGDAIARCAIAFLAMLLLSPAAHPWYLLWALVLVPLAPSRAVWAASLTLPWGYAALCEPAGWSVPAWLMVVAWAPVYTMLVLDFVAAKRRSREAHAHAQRQ